MHRHCNFAFRHVLQKLALIFAVPEITSKPIPHRIVTSFLRLRKICVLKRNIS